MPAPANGPACLTFHVHADVFTGQQNTSFVGVASERGGEVFFKNREGAARLQFAR